METPRFDPFDRCGRALIPRFGSDEEKSVEIPIPRGCRLSMEEFTAFPILAGVVRPRSTPPHTHDVPSPSPPEAAVASWSLGEVREPFFLFRTSLSFLVYFEQPIARTTQHRFFAKRACPDSTLVCPRWSSRPFCASRNATVEPIRRIQQGPFGLSRHVAQPLLAW